MRSVNNIEDLRELAWAFRESRVLQVANSLGVFSILSKGPFTAREVAKRSGSDLEMTEKLLIACTALGLTRFDGERYANSNLANMYLVKGKPFYQGDWIAHASDLWNEWSNLDDWVGGNKPSEEDEHRRFIMAMHDIAVGGEAEELATHVDLKERKLLFDVGGGPGTYSIILCKHNPQLRATIFDLPETIRITKEVIKQFGMSDRVSTREGDWNKDDFGKGNDVVLMSNILHGPGSRAEMKLQKAFKSMNKGGLLIIRDFILSESKTGPLSSALFNIMVGAYSIQEITGLITDSGFVNVRELHIPHQTHSILLADKP